MLPRRPALAVPALLIAVAAATAGCSGDEASDVASTTCGEVRAMTATERLDLLAALARSQGDPGRAYADADTATRETMAARLLEGCRDADADEPLQEVSAFPTPSATPTASR
ncbi:hypothetical protein [Nocardioides litoris]|uniref:hypothetical protein n=1 Tax=Nocardioides litoris TaxID=1926648 RepID=UPI0011209A5E|nr:hypothetical protein [Nocardioides litoris]